MGRFLKRPIIDDVRSYPYPVITNIACICTMYILQRKQEIWFENENF